MRKKLEGDTMHISRIAGMFALLAASTAAHSSLVYDFDAGAQGWTGAGGTPVFSWQPTGGIANTGYIRTVDMTGGQMVAVSPSLGDQSSLLGGSLSFGYNVFALQSGNVYVPNAPFGTVTISSGNSFVIADLIANIPFAANIAGSGWHIASLGLDNASWTGNASLSSVLSNVTSVSILTEYDRTQRWPDEIVGIDNFALSAAKVPEPATVALLGLGLAGMLGVSRRKRT